MNLPKVAVVFTGGTISMKVDPCYTGPFQSRNHEQGFFEKDFYKAQINEMKEHLNGTPLRCTF